MGQRAVRGRVEEGHGVPEAAGSRRRGVLVPRERFGGDERRRRPQRLRHVSDTPVMMVCAVPETQKTFLQSTTRGHNHNTQWKDMGRAIQGEKISLFSSVT